MNGSPILDAIIVVLPLLGMAVGWMGRSEKADRDCDRAYQRGYADAVRQHGK
jgi:hypothetical protein